MKQRVIGLDVALARQGYEVRQHASDPNEIRVNCMFCRQLGHSQDTRFRLGINIKTGQAHCFQCHWRTRDIYKLLEKQSGQRIRQPDNAYESTHTPVEEPELPEGFELFFSTVEEDEKLGFIRGQALKYLHTRGVSTEQVERNNIGFCTIGRYAYRVVFPIYYKKKLVTFIARDFTGKQKVKFLNRKGIKPLWATNDIGEQGSCTVILYEGIFKALAGERDAPYLTRDTVVHAATLGSQITDFQLMQLNPNIVQEVILFPDPDRPGMSGFLKVGHALEVRQYERLTVVSPLPRQECDEMDSGDINECILNRQPFYAASWGMANYVTMED